MKPWVSEALASTYGENVPTCKSELDYWRLIDQSSTYWQVGGLANYYGTVQLRKTGEDYYLGLEDHSSEHWEKVPVGVAFALLAWEATKPIRTG